MKTLTRILIAFLILYGLMPLMGAIFCFFNQPQQAEWMGLGVITPGLEKLLLMFGVMLVGQVFLYFSTISLLVTGMKQGYMYAVTVGLIELIQSIIIVIAMMAHNMGNAMNLIAIFKGAFLCMLALVAFKKQPIT